MDKNNCNQAQESELDPYHPHGGKREPAPERCPLTFTCMSWDAHRFTGSNVHAHAEELNIK